MDDLVRNLAVIIVLAPLVGAVFAGLGGKLLGRTTSHRITILMMLVALFCTCWVFKLVQWDNASFDGTMYTWGVVGRFTFAVGFLVDHLTSVMLLVVTFVSTLVHIYSIGYMKDDPGYQRFFSYISLFTFMMLMLVLANNFLQLFFGWEGVGLVSYLLIGFWFKKPSANVGALKAFIVNRVGDFGFILGIAAIVAYFGSINFQDVFAHVPMAYHHHTTISIFPGVHWSIITVICILLFVGAAGKSAQIPLHVWLPESMEGPTPISALIHAATMVTAGVYMVARLSPIFEFSQPALSLVLVIGASGALYLGLVGVVQHDIKRVVAYSTLSQLGYMVAGLGASAFAAGVFHLSTHACFKALLFLSAGSVIIGMHHEQDMRKMGGLYKYMPITWICFLIGGLSLAAIPPFSGFYSKDAIIEAVHHSTIPGSGYAYICVLLGAFVTALYIFRAFFLTFHGKENMDEHTKEHLKESPWQVCLPMILLAIASVVQGAFEAWPALYEKNGLFGHSIFVLPQYNVLGEMAKDYHGWWSSAWHAVFTLPFWFAVAGIVVAWFFCTAVPTSRAVFIKCIWPLYRFLVAKFGFDDFNDIVIVRSTRGIASFFSKYVDRAFIDNIMVNGSGRAVALWSKILRRYQSGYLYHYAFAMVIGLVVLLIWLMFTGDKGLLLGTFTSHVLHV